MRTLITSLLFISLLIPGFSFAEENTSGAQPKPTCPALVQGIARGAQGNGVRELQLFLSSHFGVASSTIATGFFGPKTQELVMKLQAQQGLEQVGSIGPKTRAAILALCTKGGGQSDFGAQPGTPDSNRTQTPKDNPRSLYPSCKIHASPVRIQPNQPVTFTWSSTNADYAVWGSGDKESANGSTTFSNIDTTTTFTLTFFGQAGSVTCKLQITVGETGNTDQRPLKPPITSVCPAIGWVEPTSPCDGKWVPRYSDGGCQIGWQCIGGQPTTTPPLPPKEPPLCPQVLPACPNPTVSLGSDGCKVLRCPPVASTTPPIVKPPVACPLIAYMPIQCDGTLVEKKDSNGCQVGWECKNVPTDSQACVTPWGGKALVEGQTVPYEPYFSQGRLSKSVVIPLMKCASGGWLLCDWQGSNCRAWRPLELQLTSYAPAPAYSAAELAAAFAGLQSMVQGVLSVFGQ